MAETTTLARPYANAVFDSAVAAGSDASAGLDAWSGALATLSVVASAPAVQDLFSRPSASAAEKADTVIRICGDELPGRAQNFVKLLAENGRLELLPEIRELFELKKAEYKQRVEVEIVTAFALTDAQAQSLEAGLKRRLDGRDVAIETSVDPDLIAGAVIRAGDLVIDGSVRGRIEKLTEAIAI